MKIKVCGNKTLEGIEALDKLNVEYLGLIFHQHSSRNVEHDTLLAEYCRTKNFNAKKVGVFVNESHDYILEKIKLFGLDMIQLHGDEQPQFCKQIRQHKPVIKVFRISDNAFEKRAIKEFEDVSDYFLFDKKSPQQYGGTGESFDWNILKSIDICIPFFLSGGIAPQDVQKIKNFEHPKFFGLDLNSRFENQPGEKNIIMIEEFIKELKNG